MELAQRRRVYDSEIEYEWAELQKAVVRRVNTGAWLRFLAKFLAAVGLAVLGGGVAGWLLTKVV